MTWMNWKCYYHSELESVLNSKGELIVRYVDNTIIMIFITEPIFFLPANFLDEAALEFGNACNGALRATACAYQQIVMGLETTGCSL